MTDRRRRAWSLTSRRAELVRGALVLAALWLYAKPDAIVLAVYLAAPVVVIWMGG